MSFGVTEIAELASLVLCVRLVAVKQKEVKNAELADFGARRMEENPESRDFQLDYLYGVSGMVLSRKARQAVFAKSLALLAAHAAEPDFQQAFFQYFMRCRWRGGERETARRAILGLLREDASPDVRRVFLDVTRGHGRLSA